MNVLMHKNHYILQNVLKGGITVKMRSWLGFISMMALCFILAACGTSDNVSGGEGNTENEEAGEMEPAVKESDNGIFRYTLDNHTGEDVTFDFTSGQRFDFSLTNEAGEQVFLFSSVSMFTQALGEETVAAGEYLSYDLEVPELDLEAGTYTLEAWLTPEEGPAFEAETEYEVK